MSSGSITPASSLTATLRLAVILLFLFVISSWLIPRPAAGFVREAWVSCHDGTGTMVDQIVDMAVMGDGSVVVCGPSDGTALDPDYLTIMYSAAGEVLWVRRVHRHLGDTPQALAADPVRGVAAVTGYSYAIDPEGLEELTLFYDIEGGELWRASHHSPGDGNTVGYDAAFDPMGSVIVTGTSYRNASEYDFFTVKYSPAGDETWTAWYDGPAGFYDQAFAVAVAPDETVYCCGRSAGGGGLGIDFCTVSYDAIGVEQWSARYDGGSGGYDEALCVETHPDGGVVVAGTSEGTGPSGVDLVVIRYDSAGTALWTVRYDGPAGGNETCGDLAVDDDGTAYVVGSRVNAVGTGTELLVVAVDGDGNYRDWFYGGPYGGDAVGHAAALDAAGNLLAAGSQTGEPGTGSSNLLVLKYDAWGELLWQQVFDGSGHGRDEAYCVAMIPGGGVAAAGFSQEESRDFVTLALEPLPCVLAACPGPGPENLPQVRCCDPSSGGLVLSSFIPYAVQKYGALVASGDIDGDGEAELLTGPGPGPAFGAHVRGFELCGAPMAGGCISLMAYGTSRYGVNVACGDLDGDGRDEIVTGAGPGRSHGSHMRAFQYRRGEGVRSLSGASVLALGMARYGVNVACGDIDGDGVDELLAGAGPGHGCGSHIRAFKYVSGSGVLPLGGVNFLAFPRNGRGVNIACGDIDGDGIDEIIAGAGPGPAYGSHCRVFDYDNGTQVTPVPGGSFFAYTGFEYGVRVAAADADGNGIADILTVPGPDPDAGCRVRAFTIIDGQTVPLEGIEFDAFEETGMGYGGTLAAAVPVLSSRRLR